MGEENKSSKKINTLGIVIVVAVVIVGGALYWWNMLRTSISTDNARVSGDLVNVSPKVAGRLEHLYVAEGQQVSRGQVLVQLDDSQYKINLQQAKAALDLAKANYAKLPDDVKSASAVVAKSADGVAASIAQYKTAETTLADAKRQFEHNKSLFASGAISKESLDSAQSNYSKALSGLEAADAGVQASKDSLADSEAKLNSLNNAQEAIYKAQIDQALAAYNNAKLTEDNTRITACAAGTVLRIPITTGENLSPGQTVLTISNLKNTWITTNIDENKVDRIKVGQKVDVRIDAYPGKVLAAKVIEVGNATQSTFSLISTENTSGNFTKVTQRIPVKIKVLDKKVILKPGMSAVVKIHTK